MISYILRRIGVSILTVIAASFLMYTLVASLDPLEDLYGSSSPNKDFLIEQRKQWLNLDQPVPVRWLSWLAGAAQCAIPFAARCDLGVTIRNQEVADQLVRSMGATLQLVTAATVFAIILGIAVGIISALRQYSVIDYTFTFTSFFLYALPSFLIGVVLKAFLAIGFNNWLRNPVMSWGVIIAVSLIIGFIVQAFAQGPLKRRLVSFGVASVVMGVTLYGASVTKWVLDPSLGPILAPLLIAACAAGFVWLIAGTQAKYAWRAAGSTAIVMIALYFILTPVLRNFEGLGVFLLFVGAVAVGIIAGLVFGEHDKGQAARIGALTGLVGMGVIIIDQFLSRWSDYMANRAINNRPIATVGSSTPNLSGDFWIHSIDSFTHLLLPTISLMLISFAAYTRYARGGMLEVLNQDYIRTARAKGLPERTVIVRHAFRNSLIPITTIVAADIGSIIGGAIITERIFSFSGMGAMFNSGLLARDPNPVMAYFLVVAILAITFNFLADLAYSALDPRVRVK